MSTAIDIASIGMVTAVGLDAPSACAAMRARLDGFQETRFVGSGGGWLVGAPVPLPRNWIGEKRMAHLAAGAICEAFASVPQARGKTALILCLAEQDRPGRPVQDNSVLLRLIAEIVEVEPHTRSRIVAHGRPSAHVALEYARKLIGAGEVPYVMIAGVDSYLTLPAIAHYLNQRRLLTPDNPNGFVPGEAAAAVLCTQSKRGGFRLFGLGLSREAASIYNAEDLPLRGDGMTAAYSAAFGETGIEMNRLGYRIADLIGEQYWFKQSALASLRLLRGRHDFQDIWSPGESLGNVGAAVGPLMIGMAWTAAQKGYAAGNPVLVEASNDAGACGAAVLAVRDA
ncbi:3-oxoacyl-ACP synthase [Mesorhizobium sp. WSM4906]|uniref:3-oxoacyl-ACP synthase n=1 Tax=Mesorhizobium sp. WSM4906 TaxID=3038546 RepID=UPI002415DEAD|nr:3-oxoacyl-ACP synthase [Mesorhizobium sp. WSM4906]WFP75852.1 3-oxoacyl-ACP synthase [Mesorhizobium sp. WSM4906]